MRAGFVVARAGRPTRMVDSFASKPGATLTSARTTNQQTGTDKQHQRNGDLDDDEQPRVRVPRAAEPARPPCFARRRARFRRGQRRNDPEEDAAQQREPAVKRATQPSMPHSSRWIGRLCNNGAQQPEPPPREQQSGRAAKHREHQLSAISSHDSRAPAPRAARTASSCWRALALREQVRDVGARDEQHERHGSEQNRRAAGTPP